MNKINYATAIFLMLAFIESNAQRALDPNKEAAYRAAEKSLLPNLSISTDERYFWNEYIRRIDETTYNVKKQDASFMSDVKTVFETVPIEFSTNAEWHDFRDKRRKYFEEISHTTDSRSFTSVFNQFLTTQQVEQYNITIREIYRGSGGIEIYPISETDSTVVLDIVWFNPVGFQQTPIPKTTLIGGTVRGVPEGQLFNDNYQLITGSQSVAISRNPGEEITALINAGGYQISYTSLAEDDLRLNTAAPIGTIITSMLSPDKYALVTSDSSGYLPSIVKWVPADGRSVVGSEYAKHIGSNVPDLRGMFLRGLNMFEPPNVRDDEYADPDGQNRKPGDKQKYMVGQHSHSYKDRAPSWNVDGGSPSHRINNDGSDRQRETTPMDQTLYKESRPNNVAIYYYIRIN